MQTIAGYNVLERLGTSVLLVERGRRRAALKLLPCDAPLDDIARTFATACAASALRDEGIAKVYDVGITPSGQAFVVSEHAPGRSLTRLLARRPLPLRRALRIAYRIARTLAAVHGAKLAHGALEPDHIIVDAERVKLINFGAPRDPALAILDRTHPPLYAAPEQCRAASSCDERSDLYALGCIVFAMIAGKPPFVSEHVGQVVMSHLMARPPKLDAPLDIRELVASLLAKSPADRPSAAYVAAVLSGVLRDVPTPGALALRWLAALVVTASVAITGTYAIGREKPQTVFHERPPASLPR